ncbi:MAG: protein kinase domain-containing protein [Haloechinothrix sp.]
MAKPPTLSARYELTSPIGRGGMGEVWAGYDKRLDRRVAVKLLRTEALPAGTDKHGLATRFVRESRMTARVEHPGVPAVFDAGADDDRLYLVMQLVPGVDLADFLVERGQLPIEVAAAIAAQLTSVLAAAHALSLVHRDLKPRNVMIRPDGTAVVLDFGVAALLDADITRLTTTGEMIGSPAYMSPEQVLGGKASTRSDLYALGCILHELLAGSRPFTAEGSFAAMRQHVDEPPPPLRARRAEVPPELEALVLDLLAKEPADRPAHAQEVYERLRPFLPVPGESGAPGALDPTRPYRQPFAPSQPSQRAATMPSEQPGADSAGAPAAGPIDVGQVRDEAVELAEAGRFTQAAEVLTGILARPDVQLAQPQLRGVRLQLANTLLLGGHYARALPEYEWLISDVSAERGDEDPDVLAWQVQAAVCRDALGQPKDALELLSPVLDIQLRQLGRIAPEVIDLRRQITLLRVSSGQVDQALNELRELLHELGPDHPENADLAEILRRLGSSATS